MLEAKYRLGLFEDPYKYCDTASVAGKIYTPEHRRVAREIATETFVLLKNVNQTLPLAPKGRIALIGPMADAANNMCGMWSMTCTPSAHESLLAAMTEELQGKAELIYSKGCNIYADETVENNANGIRPIARGNDETLLRPALAAASKADVIVAALGESAEMSGESASRADIQLPRCAAKTVAKPGRYRQACGASPVHRPSACPHLGRCQCRRHTQCLVRGQRGRRSYLRRGLRQGVPVR